MKRLAACIFAIALMAGNGAAEPPVCTGTNLLEKLKAENPAKYAEVMKEADAIPNGEALFWRIERTGIAPSYLLGTAHVTDPRVTTLPPGAEAALSGARIVALELAELRDQKEMILATFRNAALMVLPSGQSLWNLIPDADEPAIRDNINLPPGAANGIYGYQPWVVAAMLSIPLCETVRKQQGLRTLDSTIAEVAEDHGIPLVGLETMKEQLSILAGVPMHIQAKYLISVAKTGPQVSDYFATLVGLYEKRQVAAYMPFVRLTETMSSDDDKIMAFIEEDLIRRRNLIMFERAQGLLDKGNVFIAVGALHLPGKNGLVAHLRAGGYKVSPIN